MKEDTPQFTKALRLLLTVKEMLLEDDESEYDEATLQARTELIKTCYDITEGVDEGLIEYTNVIEIVEPYGAEVTHVHTLTFEQVTMMRLIWDLTKGSTALFPGCIIVQEYANKYPEAGLADGYDPCYIAELLLAGLEERACIEMILPDTEDFTVVPLIKSCISSPFIAGGS